jgi:hypothetical protein
MPDQSWMIKICKTHKQTGSNRDIISFDLDSQLIITAITTTLPPTSLPPEPFHLHLIASSNMLNVVIIGASTAGHIIASQLAPKLPASHRIVIVDPAPTSYWPIASLRAAVVPGFESKVYHKLEQKNFFPANSKNVLVRQRVVSVEPASIVLDGEFEGSSHVAFDVSRSRRFAKSKSIFLTE